jgi:radical SAM-linked protein
MSEGFHPRARMSFPSALAVGVAGTDEVVEIELTEACQPQRLAAQVAPHCPPGLELRAVELLPCESRAAQVAKVCYEITAPEDCRAALAERIDAIRAGAPLVVDRGGERQPIDVQPLIESIDLSDGGRLSVCLRVTREGGARPRDLLASLGLAHLEQQGRYMTRTRVELEP